MTRNWAVTAVALVLVLGLTACETSRRLPGAGDDAPTNLSLAGERANRAELASLRRNLSRLKSIDVESDEGRASAKRLLKRIEDRSLKGEEVPEDLRGIGGFHARLLVKSALSTRDELLTQNLSGKIRRYIFNEENDAGYLEVDTRVETLVNGVKVKTDKYFWSIAVLPGTYRVIKKDNRDPNDPFPGTVPLPPDALDPDNPRGIIQRGLDHKLFAKGRGIVVLAVTKNGDLLPAEDPVYQSDDESCVDILFNGEPPANRLPNQSAYCLGRCDDPLIVNTGM